MRPLFHAQKGQECQKPLVADIHVCSFLPLASIYVNLDTSKLICYVCDHVENNFYFYIISI